MIVICKIRLPRVWIKRCEGERKGGRVRVEKLQDEGDRRKYVSALEKRKRIIDEKGNVEAIWKELKDNMLESAIEVCGKVKLGPKRKGCEWWSDEIKRKVEEKKKM